MIGVKVRVRHSSVTCHLQSNYPPFCRLRKTQCAGNASALAGSDESASFSHSFRTTDHLCLATRPSTQVVPIAYERDEATSGLVQVCRYICAAMTLQIVRDCTPFCRLNAPIYLSSSRSQCLRATLSLSFTELFQINGVGIEFRPPRAGYILTRYEKTHGLIRRPNAREVEQYTCIHTHCTCS
jgi:hypothetical protein